MDAEMKKKFEELVHGADALDTREMLNIVGLNLAKLVVDYNCPSKGYHFIKEVFSRDFDVVKRFSEEAFKQEWENKVREYYDIPEKDSKITPFFRNDKEYVMVTSDSDFSGVIEVTGIYTYETRSFNLIEGRTRLVGDIEDAISVAVEMIEESNKSQECPTENSLKETLMKLNQMEQLGIISDDEIELQKVLKKFLEKIEKNLDKPIIEVPDTKIKTEVSPIKCDEPDLSGETKSVNEQVKQANRGNEVFETDRNER